MAGATEITPRRKLAEAVLGHFRARGPARLLVAIVAVGVFHEPGAPEPTREGLAELLGDASGGSVAPGEVVWAERRNAFAELLFGRGVLFLSAHAKGAPRDLYRAVVRLTPGGQPLSVTELANLTDTPLADETGLGVAGGRAVYATLADQRPAALTLFGLAESGGTRDFFFAPSVTGVSAKLDDKALTFGLEPLGGEVRYDLATGAVAGDGADHLRVVERRRSEKSVLLAAVDSAEGLASEPVLALGRRAAYALWALLRGSHSRPPNGATPEPPSARIVQARHALRSEEVWPPPRVPRPEYAAPEEGAWTPVLSPPAPGASSHRDAAFYRTTVHPDPNHRGTRVVLVAIDLRQLELGIEAGSEHPRPSLGPPGAGRLPASARGRVMAVIHGGASTGERRYGMKASGRVLVAPLAGAPSIATLGSGETSLGVWPFGSQIPARIASFRQGLALLIGDEEVLAREDEAAAHVFRTRSGLCVTPAGQLYYGYSESSDRASLGRAFVHSGCAVAVELGGSFEPHGMALVSGGGSEHPRFTKLDDSMPLDPQAMFRASSRDFLYLAERDLTPRRPEGARFRPDSGTQPAPPSLTGIFRAAVPLGGIEVDLLTFENGRVEWTLRAGPREPGARGEPWVARLPEGALERALAVLELGHATVAPRPGLALGATDALALKAAFATLVLKPTDPPEILLPGDPLELREGEQAVQLPLLADGGAVTEQARDRGDVRDRSALGVSASGRVLVAFLRHDSSDPLAVALIEAGAERVVELDRGSHHPAALERAGTDSPPSLKHETTTLWALSRPMIPGGRVGID